MLKVSMQFFVSRPSQLLVLFATSAWVFAANAQSCAHQDGTKKSLGRYTGKYEAFEYVEGAYLITADQTHKQLDSQTARGDTYMCSAYANGGWGADRALCCGCGATDPLAASRRVMFAPGTGPGDVKYNCYYGCKRVNCGSMALPTTDAPVVTCEHHDGTKKSLGSYTGKYEAFEYVQGAYLITADQTHKQLDSQLAQGDTYMCSAYASGGWGADRATCCGCGATDPLAASRRVMFAPGTGPGDVRYNCYYGCNRVDCAATTTEAPVATTVTIREVPPALTTTPIAEVPPVALAPVTACEQHDGTKKSLGHYTGKYEAFEYVNGAYLITVDQTHKNLNTQSAQGDTYMCSAYATGGWGADRATCCGCGAKDPLVATRRVMFAPGTGPNDVKYNCYYGCKQVYCGFITTTGTIANVTQEATGVSKSQRTLSIGGVVLGVLCIYICCCCFCFCYCCLRPRKEKLIGDDSDSEESDVELPEGAMCPSYWTNQDLSEDFDERYEEEELVPIVQQMLDTTWKDIVTRDRKGGKPDRLEVVSVQRFEDSGMWAAYLEQKEKIKTRGPLQSVLELDGDFSKGHVLTDAFVRHLTHGGQLDQHLNEHYLFHGTSPDAAENIAESGFRINLAGSNAGTMFGRGAYFAECSSKADEYAVSGAGAALKLGLHGFSQEDDEFAILLCRVSCGKMFRALRASDKSEFIPQVEQQEIDGVLGDREASVGTYREFVVFKESMIYPEYRVLYHRVYDEELE